MLHTKFMKRRVLKGFTIYGHSSHLGHVTQIPRSNFRSPAPGKLHMKFGFRPGRVAQSVGHLTRKSGFLGSIPGLATYFRFSFRFFKKGSCQLLAKVCARSTG